MTMTLITWALSLTGCSTAILAVWLAWRVHQKNAVFRKQVRAQLQQQGEQSQILMTGAVGMGHRLLALENKLAHLREEETSESSADHYPYAQAMHMFDSGADVDAVAASCGLSQSEANLMQLIRRQSKTVSEDDALLTD